MTKTHHFSISKFYVVITVFLATISGCGGGAREKSLAISMSGAFALYPLANKWAEEFQKKYPDVRFNISAGGAGKGMADALAQAVDLGMLSREVKDEERDLGAWSIAVTIDAVVPTMNANNPALNSIVSQGLSREDFAKIFLTREIAAWGQVIRTNSSGKINVYTRSDASGAAATWAQYLGGKEQDELNGIGVFADPGLAEAVKNDINGIGYNNIIYIYDLYSKKKYPGIEVIPIDVNDDDRITEEELFYDDMNQLVAAISEGRFPSPPARPLYFVSKGKPKNEMVVKFLHWVLTEGQQYVGDTGYIKLSEEKIESELTKLQ